MRRSIFSVGLLAVMLTVSASAQEATLKAVKGTVRVRSAQQKQWHAAKPGQALKRNDQVKLGTASLAQVEFTSGATLLVKENSWFSLRRDAKGNLVSFRVGEFLIGLKKKLTGDQQFRVRTPVSVAAVRGTVFWGKSDENKTATFACFTGFIDVTGNGKTVKLEPGQKTVIALNTTPTEPEAANIPKEYIQTFSVDGSLADLDTLIDAESQP